MDKEDVVYLFNEMLLSHKKEWNNPFVVTWMDLEINQSEETILNTSQ